ncbi:MAG: hypothetical protein WDO15_03990 [Bacteroidota bacterium]
MPPESLRIERDVIERLHKLGLHRISQFMNMPRSSLRKRFGQAFIERIDQAMGDSKKLSNRYNLSNHTWNDFHAWSLS